MSFRVQPSPPARPNRCQLFGPGSRPATLREDGDLGGGRDQPRPRGLASPPTTRPRRGRTSSRPSTTSTGARKTLSVRINGLDTPFWYRDVVDLLEQACDRLDQIMIPKVGCAADIYAVDALVSSIEAAKGRQEAHRLRGHHRDRRAASPMSRRSPPPRPRLQAMSLGAADFAASMGMQTTGIGGTQENYYMVPGRPEILARPLALGAGRHRRRLPHAWPPAGRRPLRRLLGRRGLPRAGAPVRDARHGRQMGDPPQAGGARERGLHPLRSRRGRGARDPRRHGRGRRRTGQGAAVYKGRLVDLASIRQAEVIVRQAEMIAG